MSSAIVDMDFINQDNARFNWCHFASEDGFCVDKFVGVLCTFSSWILWQRNVWMFAQYFALFANFNLRCVSLCWLLMGSFWRHFTSSLHVISICWFLCWFRGSFIELELALDIDNVLVFHGSSSSLFSGCVSRRGASSCISACCVAVDNSSSTSGSALGVVGLCGCDDSVVFLHWFGVLLTSIFPCSFRGSFLPIFSHRTSCWFSVLKSHLFYGFFLVLLIGFSCFSFYFHRNSVWISCSLMVWRFSWVYRGVVHSALAFCRTPTCLNKMG